jgi:cardiolipin synthase
MVTMSIGWLITLCVLLALAIFIAANVVTAEKRLRKRPKSLYTSGDVDFRRSLGLLLGPSILAGNHVRILLNGDGAFPAMLNAINTAQNTITFESYIFRDAIAHDFCDTLANACRRGVRVHVLLDWLGSKQMDLKYLEPVKAAGGQVQLYHEFGWTHWRRINNRTHRKLLIVDGKVGFTGGLGIGAEWTGNAQNAQHWRDTHYEVTGPVVAQMQAVFMDNWIKATGDVLHGELYFPTLARTGTYDCQMFASSPEGGSESMHLMILLAIAAASETIDIVNSYFVPNQLTIDALIAAQKRGVRVRILVPSGKTDAPLGRWAAHALYSTLLDAGIEICEYQPTMTHSKIMVVDSRWVSVGSCNFDDRSFRLNDEANLNVFDAGFAAEQLKVLEADFAKSKRITPRRWARRSVERRILERLAITFRSQL